MEQYISKSSLIGEIKKMKGKFINQDDEFSDGYHFALKLVLNFLNTLEVKEADLEKEVEDWVKTGPHTSYPWCTIPDAIRITAEHFFELGLKAKGE